MSLAEFLQARSRFEPLSWGLAFLSILLFLNKHGLTFALPGQTITTVLYPTITIAFLLKVFFLALLSALGASFVPAYRASKMKPVQALTTN